MKQGYMLILVLIIIVLLSLMAGYFYGVFSGSNNFYAQILKGQLLIDDFQACASDIAAKLHNNQNPTNGTCTGPNGNKIQYTVEYLPTPGQTGATARKAVLTHDDIHINVYYYVVNTVTDGTNIGTLDKKEIFMWLSKPY